jgi:hypothetical protein
MLRSSPVTQNDKIVRGKDQRTMAEKMKCSRGMVV